MLGVFYWSKIFEVQFLLAWVLDVGGVTRSSEGMQIFLPLKIML